MYGVFSRGCSCAFRAISPLRQPILPRTSLVDVQHCRYLSVTRRAFAADKTEPPTPAPPTEPPAPVERQQPSEKPKSKVKPTASLRRAASASLPIRANPTPTRSEIKPVLAISTAEGYDLTTLLASLPSSTKTTTLVLPNPGEGFEEALWIPEWKGREVEVFVFRNGTYVCWGMEEDDALEFGKDVVRSVKDAEVGPLKKLETEELDFVSDPSEQTRLQGDIIILGSNPSQHLLARYAFSQALARSCALSALESALDEYLLSVAGLPDSLSETGKMGLTRKALLMKLGQLLKFRQGVNLNRENFADTPDFYWTEPELEGYFDSVSRALEMRSRLHSFNAKITYAAETQEVLRQLSTDSNAHRMELIIIYLIAVEVTIALIYHSPDLYYMVAGRPEPARVTGQDIDALIETAYPEAQK